MNTDILSELTIQHIHSISTMYNEKGASSKRKNRPLWAFVIKYEGQTIYAVNGRPHISDLHNVTILPKGCRYDWQCVESGRFIIVEFDCDQTCDEIFSFSVKNGESLLGTVRKMEINRARLGCTQRLDEFRDLYGILSSLIKSANKKYVPSPKERIIYPITEYIAQNCGKHISADELSAMTDFSAVYFRKVFKDVTGMSPIRYVRTIKINKAKEMLESDYSSVTNIAASLGYNNVYEFSRDFKKQVGISPSRYKKQ